MTTRHDLVLLTSEFPFGRVGETFLETEITVLAERFSRLYVLPSTRPVGRRALPANAEVVEMDWLGNPSSRSLRRALATHEAAWVAVHTGRSESNLRPYFDAPRTYAHVLARNVLKFRSLARFARDRRLAHAIFYDYWFENSTLALALLRRSGAIRTAVSRAHGFDVYDERWEAGRVPFRDAKATGLDRVFAVSEYGRRYLEERAPALRGKVSVERLGVSDPGRAGPAKLDDIPLIVTCGRLIPTKHTHLVPDVLNRLARPVHWVHLGDGPERARVTAAATRLDGQVAWELRGQVDNRDVSRFYASHHVDVLLSLSTSEGLPVAMMEAQSYGIPVVARAVHGIPEIVNDVTGILLAPQAMPAEAAAAVDAALQPGRFSVERIREFFRDNFDAQVNYNGFADALIALHQSEAAAA